MTESQHDAADALIRTTKRLRACTTTIHERVHHAFTEHPRSQRMTYCEHFKRAAWTALRLARGAAALAVHAVFPFLLQTTGSDTVKTLHGELKEHEAAGELKEHEAAGEPKEDIPEHEGPKEDIVQELIDGLEEPLPQEDSEESQESQEDSEDQQEESQHESQEESQEESSGCESCDAYEDQVGLCEPLPQEELNEQALEEEELGAPLEQDELSKKSN